MMKTLRSSVVNMDGKYRRFHFYIPTNAIDKSIWNGVIRRNHRCRLLSDFFSWCLKESLTRSEEALSYSPWLIRIRFLFLPIFALDMTWEQRWRVHRVRHMIATWIDWTFCRRLSSKLKWWLRKNATTACTPTRWKRKCIKVRIYWNCAMFRRVLNFYSLFRRTTEARNVRLQSSVLQLRRHHNSWA